MSLISTHKWMCDVCDQEINGFSDTLPKNWSQLKYEVFLGYAEGHLIDVCDQCWPREHSHRNHKKTVFKAFMQRLAKSDRSQK